jgi:hypothetical protein
MIVPKIIRGCGERVKGGLYVRVATSPYGMPIEHFLIDPPLEYYGSCNLAPFFQGDDAYFWVGEKFYPFCPDFIEETRLYGASKRISIDTDLSKFKPYATRLFFIHPKAVADLVEPVHECPKNKPEHLKGTERCITDLYYLIDGREVAGDGGVFYERTIGSTSYTTPRIVSRESVKFSPGIFMWLPFSHFEYVLPDDNRVDPRIQTAINGNAPVMCVKEE